MRVVVVGATGVLGRAAVAALVESGYDVAGLARGPGRARLLRDLGAEPCAATLADHDALVGMLSGADAVCNLLSRVPVGLAAMRPDAWRTHDRLRTEGSRRIVAAAREARVRRLVQASVSDVYADQGDAWVTEDSPLGITRATEPASVAEAHVQDFDGGARCGGRVGVVLRLGGVVGDDPQSRYLLRSAGHGHPVGLGSPDGWAHVLHEDDLGGAVVTALGVPGGVYNVGAEPVRRRDLMDALAVAAGRDEVSFVGPLARRLGGVRLEPRGRSLRVSSARFAAAGGWRATRERVDPSWFGAPTPSGVAW